MNLYYQDEGAAIYLGDCREVLRQLVPADVILTDAPYDAKTHNGARTSRDIGQPEATSAIEFGFEPIDGLHVAQMLVEKAARWVVTFCALEQLGDYKRGADQSWVRAGFYYRRDSAPQFTGDRPAQPGEGLAIMHRAGKKRWNGGGKMAYYEDVVVRQGRLHPAQKPVTVMLALVADFSDPGELILDPFMGSGTTLVAARQLGRRAIGIEQEERYCAAAVKRLRQVSLPLFGGWNR